MTPKEGQTARREPLMRIAAPAWKFVVPLIILAVICAIIWWPAAIVFVVLALYVLYFFRIPGRHVPSIPGCFVSPAEGKVVSVVEVPAEQMNGGRARRIAIFLNIFDVHVQRIPQSGVVRDIQRKQGKFINALNEKCSEENEQLTVWIESDDGGIYGIRQIAGAIARRIVCHIQPGDHVERGQIYGLIQFGSRVELFVDPEATVKVQPGQRVKAGATALAIMHEEAARKGRFPTKETPVPRQATGS